MSGDPDRLTILTTFGPPMTKTLGPGADGRVTVLETCGLAEYFRHTTAIVHGLHDVLRELEQLATCPRSCLVRGEVLPGADPGYCRRLLHDRREDDGTVTPATFAPRPRR